MVGCDSPVLSQVSHVTDVSTCEMEQQPVLCFLLTVPQRERERKGGGGGGGVFTCMYMYVLK